MYYGAFSVHNVITVKDFYDKIVLTRLDRYKWTHKIASKQFAQEHNNIAFIHHSLTSLPKCNIDIITKKTKECDYYIDIHNFMKLSYQYTIDTKYQCNTIMAIPNDYYKGTLYINNTEIPSNEPNQIRYAALSPDLLSFFKQKYKWSHATINKIDWEVHSRALNLQHPIHLKTLIQYIHRWLPTHGHPATKIDFITKCPCCHK